MVKTIKFQVNRGLLLLFLGKSDREGVGQNKGADNNKEDFVKGTKGIIARTTIVKMSKLGVHASRAILAGSIVCNLVISLSHTLSTYTPCVILHLQAIIKLKEYYDLNLIFQFCHYLGNFLLGFVPNFIAGFEEQLSCFLFEDFFLTPKTQDLWLKIFHIIKLFYFIFCVKDLFLFESMVFVGQDIYLRVRLPLGAIRGST